MIKAKFLLSDGMFFGFSISGHANFDDFGKDIVCASVTSAVQLCINGVTECLHIKSNVEVLKNEINFNFPKSCDNQSAIAFLKALYLHLDIISQDYPENIKLSTVEV